MKSKITRLSMWYSRTSHNRSHWDQAEARKRFGPINQLVVKTAVLTTCLSQRLLGSTKPDCCLLVHSTLWRWQSREHVDLCTASCALSSTSGALTSASQGKKLLLTSKKRQGKAGLGKTDAGNERFYCIKFNFVFLLPSTSPI